MAEQIDVLLVVVTPVELQALLQAADAITKTKRIHHPERTYHDLGFIGGARVAVVQTEMGTTTLGGSLSTVKTAIQEVHPSTIMMVGIAFGVSAHKQPIGQVLVSRQIMQYEPQRVGKTETVPRGDKAMASPTILSRLRAVRTDMPVEFGLVLTGEKLFDNVEVRDRLLAMEPEAIGGEMEGGGVYVAAVERGIPWCVIKAVCDYADGNKGENKKESQRLAAASAATFALLAIADGGFRSGTVAAEAASVTAPAATARPTVDAEPARSFAWIHVSDLYFGRANQAVLDALVADAHALAARERLPVDAVIVSGDVAYHGAAAEYRDAAAWLQRLRAAGGKPAALLVVPGNHDVDRRVAGVYPTFDLISTVRSKARGIDDAYADPRMRQALQDSVAAFAAFAGGELAHPAWTRQWQVDGVTIAFCGISSVLLSCDDDDRGRLALATEQLQQIKARDDRTVSAVITHHPLSSGWLENESHALGWVSRRADIHFSGHVDKPGVQVVHHADTSLHVITSGASADGGQRAYSVGAVLVGERSIRLRVYPRRWSDDDQAFGPAPAPELAAGETCVELTLRDGPRTDAARRRKRAATEPSGAPDVADARDVRDVADTSDAFIRRGDEHEARSESRAAAAAYDSARAAAAAAGNVRGQQVAMLRSARLALAQYRLDAAAGLLDTAGALGRPLPPDHLLLRARCARLRYAYDEARARLLELPAAMGDRLSADRAVEQAVLEADRTRQLELFADAIRLYRSARDDDELGVSSLMRQVLVADAILRRAVATRSSDGVREALEAYRQLGYGRGEAHAFCVLSRLAGNREDHEDAYRSASAAFSLARTLDDGWLRALAHVAVGWSSLSLGDLPGADDAAVFALADAGDATQIVADAHFLRGVIGVHREQHKRAREHFAAARDAYRRCRAPETTAQVQLWIIQADLDLGDATSARQLLQQVEPSAALKPNLELIQARLDFLDHGFARGLDRLRALELGDKRAVQLEAIFRRAEYLLDQDEHLEAKRLFDQARGLGESIKAKYWLVKLDELESRYLERLGSLEKAREMFTRTEASYVQLGNAEGARRCRERAARLPADDESPADQSGSRRRRTSKDPFPISKRVFDGLLASHHGHVPDEQLAERIERALASVEDSPIASELVQRTEKSLGDCHTIHAVDVLGPQAWVSSSAFRYLAVQLRHYARANVRDGRWDLRVTPKLGGAIVRAIENAKAEQLRQSETGFDEKKDFSWSPTRGRPRLELARILLWTEEELESTSANVVIDFHQVFHVPLFFLPTPPADRACDFVAYHCVRPDKTRYITGAVNTRQDDGKFKLTQLLAGEVQGRDVRHEFERLLTRSDIKFAIDARVIRRGRLGR